MAYPTLDAITDKFVGQPYDLNSVLTPAQVWAKLDAQAEEVRVALNTLVNALNSTGTDNWIYQQIANAILNQVADGSLTDVKLSDVAGQIKSVVANHVPTDSSTTTKGHIQIATTLEVTTGADALKAVTPAGLKTVSDTLIPLSQLPNLSSKVMSRALSTKTASFPARTGTTPNFVYTMVTVTIPISATVEEVILNVGQGRINLFRGLNYGIGQSDNSGTAKMPTITPVNLSYGSTFTGASGPTALVGTNAFFASSDIALADAYISGTNIVIVAYSNLTVAINSASQNFEYIARG